MIIDCSYVQFPTKRRYDYVVIGVGSAGILLAKRIIKKKPNARICLIESGGTKAEEKVNNLDLFRSFKNSINLTRSISRRIGGKSNLWDGRIISPEEEELKTWDIDINELKGYLNQALKILGINDTRETLHESSTAKFNADYLGSALKDSFSSSTAFFAETTKRFGLKDLGVEALHKSNNIDIFIHADVQSLILDSSDLKVQKVIIKDTLGAFQTSFSVKGKIFILANGGIEIIRTLMLSAGIWRKIGSLIGRNFSGHPRGVKGLIKIKSRIKSNSVLLSATQSKDSVKSEIGLRLKSTNLNKGPISRIVLNPVSKSLHNKFYYFYRPQMSYMRDYLNKNGVSENGYLSGLYYYIVGYLKKKLNIPEFVEFIYIRNYCGSSLNPDSKVLQEGIDKNNKPKIFVDWKISIKDKKNLKTSQLELFKKLKDHIDIEVLDSVDCSSWDLWGGSSHFMSTTVMKNNSNDGVVDRNCKVNNVDNLYITGPSVFTTPSHANPMLMIVALALRLGDYLSKI